MAIRLAGNWWALALRGLAAVLFGVACFVWPGLAFSALLYGAYALVDGIFAIVAALITREHGAVSRPLLLESFLGIGVGIITFLGIGVGIIAFLWPGITGLALNSLIAFWALATGIFRIVAGIRLRGSIQGEWLLALSGVLSVVFALLLVIWHPESVVTLAWRIGLYALMLGVLLLALAFRLRHWGRTASMQR
jgi:uncharacterized membrane protein HdeD (DUF308 family)